MDLQTIWKITRKRMWLVIALGLLAAGVSGWLQSQQVPQYRTTTTLFLNPAVANPLLPFQVTKTVQSVANTYIEFMRTRSFSDLVAKQSGYALSPDDILRSLSAQYVPDTQFFRISATFTDPNVAQSIVNTAAQTLIAENAARQQAEQAQIKAQQNENPDRQELSDLRDSLRQELQLHTERIAALQLQVSNLEVRSPSERNDERLTSLRAELIAAQQARSQTLNSLAQVQSALVVEGSAVVIGPGADTAVIVDPAPIAMIIPQPFVRNVLVWLVAGLIAGVGLSMGLHYIDYTVRSPDVLEETYGMAAQGVVGVAQRTKRRPPYQADPIYQLTVSNPQSPEAEAVRALRTSIQFAGLGRPIRSLMLTSAGPGEGKTFVAANLAVSMAQNGSTVILVDIDLRRPQLHDVFAVPREPGFSNLVLGRERELLATIGPQLQTIYQRARNHEAIQRNQIFGGGVSTMSLGAAQRLLRDVETDDPELQTLIDNVRGQIEIGEDITSFLQPSGVPNLLLLTCGGIPPQPAELLSSPRAAQVMARLSEYADIVIYDLPPAGLLTDALIVAPHIDAVLHVVRAGGTRIDLIRRCRTAIEQSGARLLGPVLNQVRLADLGSYGYYSYYGYGPQKRGRGPLGWLRNGRAGQAPRQKSGALPHEGAD